MNQTISPGIAGPLKNAILIAGPTASGKSGLAVELARQVNGVVVNADSMQVYRQLRIVSARPTEAEMAGVVHYLYGHVDAWHDYSTARWLNDVAALLASDEIGEGRRVIFVGGTGLYFKALAEGLSEMPDIPAPVRQYWRRRLAAEGPQFLHGLLARRDPETANALRPADGHRIIRALEVLEASGRSIREWQKQRGSPLVVSGSAQKIILEPERGELHARIDRRLDMMVAAGALEEVRKLTACALDPAMPAMKAIGIREFSAYLSNEVSLEQAIAAAKAATRQYAKRQLTWFRNQMGPDWTRQPHPGSTPMSSATTT